jgi:arylsulfatase A-like enzyme
VLAHVLARLVPTRAAWLSRPRGALAALLAGAMAPLALAALVEQSLLVQLDLRPFVAVAVALAVVVTGLFLGVGAPLQRWRGSRRVLVAIGLPIGLLALALGLGRLDRVRKSAVAFTGLTPPLVAGLHAVTDLDRDGYSSILGGGDCDDLDPEVHPGAFDWPDDGIDQNCNQHQATLQTPPRAPFAAVPPSLPGDLNVVLITIDALRADHVGAYGYARPTTPRLDALARESTLFADAWAHAPSTRYSIPAILTGRYPSAIHSDPVIHWPPKILDDNRLFAEIMKDRGYHTGATASYWYFERELGLAQGFDDYDVHLQTLHSGKFVAPAQTSGTSARQLADLDVDWIAAHKGEKFFFWSHFYDTHFGFERHPDMPESNFGNNEIDLYDGEIRFTDYHVGRVLDALKEAGIWDKTIVVITSDHGDGFGEHGIPPDQRHGYHLYANETKVPLIIHVPTLPPRRVDTPVGHIDILPTVLNLIGGRAEDEPTLLGKSALGPMLGQPATPPLAVFQEVTYEGPSSRLNGTQRRAVVTPEWHYIRNVIPDATVELYRRSDDAPKDQEDHDRAGLGEPAERELAHLLAAWMDQLDLPPDFQRRIAGNVAPTPFAPQIALGDLLDGWLVLDGVDVAQPTVRGGDQLEFTLYWHAKARPPAGWRLFTHVRGAGRMINADHEPLENLYPVSRLRPGTFLRDRVRVTVPPGPATGPLHIEVGLWRGPERAAIRGAHASPELFVDAATVTVTP